MRGRTGPKGEKKKRKKEENVLKIGEWGRGEGEGEDQGEIRGTH